MKPILRERRREAMSRTRTPGPGPAPGPTEPAGATSLLELGREGQDGAEVGCNPVASQGERRGTGVGVRGGLKVQGTEVVASGRIPGL